MLSTDGNLRLAEVSKMCGCSVDTLRLLIADGKLDQVLRSDRGHSYLPADSVPSQQECRTIIEQRRDHYLRHAQQLLDRLDVELEAVRNDIAEAREHPGQELGIDLVAFGSYARRWDNTNLSTVLHQLDVARRKIERYHCALLEVLQLQD
jgi:DNA-binding transcriptional MerR regulator